MALTTGTKLGPYEIQSALGYRQNAPLLLYRRCNLFLVGRGQRTLTLGDRQQSWIELHKCGVHSRMCGVAAIAVGGSWDHLRGLAVVKGKESPLPRKMCFVLQVHFKGHDLAALIVAFLVNRAFALGAAAFNYEHCFVGPAARLQQCPIRLRI